eukprot:gene13094-3627_t
MGSEFATGDVSVTVGGDACVIDAGAGTTTTQITCASAAKAAGSHAVVVTNTVTSGASNSDVVVTYVAPPVVTSVSPSSRGTAGTVNIVIMGSEFATGDVSVTVGGDACVIDAGAGTTTTQITCASAAKAAGSHAVVVTNTVTSGASNSDVVVTYVAPPVVTSVSPSSRGTAGTVNIVIIGSEFATGDVSVTVGGDACVIDAGAGTTTTCASAAKAAGSHAVVVTNTVTSGASNSDVVVTYVAPPVVTSVSPSSRGTAGTVNIVIMGSEFATGDVSVTVGGDACVIDAGAGTTTTQITCASAAKAAGSHAVVVTNTVTSGASNSDVVVTYVAPPVVTSVSPSSRGTAGTVNIVIMGSEFATGDVSVTVGGDACVIDAGAGTTTTQITCASAAKAAGSHAVVVTNTVTSGASNSDVVVTYVAPPVVTSVSPSSRGTAGTVNIVIIGSEFATGDVSVTVGGDACVIDAGAGTTTTQITCASAAKAAGSHAVVVTNTVTSGASNSDVVVTYVAPPVVTSVSPSSRGTAGTVNIVIMGSEFATGDVSVTVGGDACVIDAGAGTTTTQITYASAAKAAGSHAVVVTNTVTSGASNSDVVVIYVAPPVVTSVSPSSRGTAGTVNIVIMGSEFATGDVSVTVGGDACVIDAGAGTTTTQITCASAAKAAGSHAVVVTNTVTSGASNSDVVVTYVAPPVVTSVSPSSRGTAGTVNIVIMGSEFATGDVSVTVGGDACVIDAGAGTTTTQITCASAAKAAGSHAVVVTNTVTSGASNSDVVVTYVAPPVVTSVSPSSRGTAGTVNIVIMGSEFATGDVSVTVGGDACVIDAGAGTTTTQITCASAAKAAGSHAVVVTNTVTSGASNSDVVVTYANACTAPAGTTCDEAGANSACSNPTCASGFNGSPSVPMSPDQKYTQIFSQTIVGSKPRISVSQKGQTCVKPRITVLTVLERPS